MRAGHLLCEWAAGGDRWANSAARRWTSTADAGIAWKAVHPVRLSGVAVQTTHQGFAELASRSVPESLNDYPLSASFATVAIGPIRRRRAFAVVSRRASLPGTMGVLEMLVTSGRALQFACNRAQQCVTPRSSALLSVDGSHQRRVQPSAGSSGSRGTPIIKDEKAENARQSASWLTSALPVQNRHNVSAATPVAQLSRHAVTGVPVAAEN